MEILVFASNNLKKLAEVRPLLPGFAIRSLEDIGFRHDLPETSGTIEGNAIQKAKFLHEQTGYNCFSDDTGLQVEAIGGLPGVDTAYYAGPERDANLNMQKLLNALKGEANRKARFVTVIALVYQGRISVFEGKVSGRISEEIRGRGGFGYDPIFIPDGYDQTFAELPLEIQAKNQPSRQSTETAGFLLRPTRLSISVKVYLCRFLQSMEWITGLFEFILHIDEYLDRFIVDYGTLTYVILFTIIFVETGLVVMPLLPGDSLLFAAGALAARNPDNLNIWYMIPLLIIAALLGDNTNYFFGKFFGSAIRSRERILFLKRTHLEKTEAYYEKYGGRTVIIARFIPIVRTVAPFVAGAGSMNYARYIRFCLIGAILWVAGVSLLGYLLGNIPLVRNNFETVIFAIIFISILPMIVEVLPSTVQQGRQLVHGFFKINYRYICQT
jgi:membrane-associated protein